MDDVLNAVLADIRESLGSVPLYTDQARMNRDNPAPPFALLVPVSEPADPSSRYSPESAAVFGLNVWGPQWRVLQIRRSLEWLRRHEIGSYGTSQNLRYGLWTRSFDREQDWLMPDGITEVWNLSSTYRCRFANFAGVSP